MFFRKLILFFICQLEEEVGSVVEQPTSNKVVTNTVKELAIISQLFLLPDGFMATKIYNSI